jgi:hypothetical protein
LVELCIFPSPTTFVTKYFWLGTWKMEFSFYYWPKGAKRVVFCEVATKGIVNNTTTSIFICRGPCRKARSKVWGIILACSHILNYFWAKSILFKFELGVHKLRFKKIAEKYLEIP